MLLGLLFTLFVLVSIVLILFINGFIEYIRLSKEYEKISILARSPIPFLGNLHNFGKNRSNVYNLMHQLAKESQQRTGGIFCLWLTIWPMVFLCSGDGLEKFINSHKQLVKGPNYKQLHPWLKTGLLTSDNEKWRSRRRLITPSFHDNQLLQNFMSIFNEQARVLADRFSQLTNDNEIAHDLYPYISACTLDIITESATGVKADAQSSESKAEFVQATIRTGEIILKRVESPWLWPSWIFDRTAWGREQKKTLKILHGFSRKVIEERIKSFDLEKTTDDDHHQRRRRLVFLDSLINQMQQEKLTVDDIQEEVDTFMFEGHDTTAAAITFFLYLIGVHPEIQKKIHEEIDSIFGDDSERECTMDDIQKMTYLDCVIKESMRILSPVPMISREAQEDFYYRDQLIRKGTPVTIVISAIHRDPNVYQNPEIFDPSRFADDSVISNQRSPFTFIPFSSGHRNCIGQRFANLEERIVLSTLLRRFSFQSTQTIDELNLVAEMVLRTEVPIRMIVKNRNIL